MNGLECTVFSLSPYPLARQRGVFSEDDLHQVLPFHPCLRACLSGTIPVTIAVRTKYKLYQTGREIPVGENVNM